MAKVKRIVTDENTSSDFLSKLEAIDKDFKELCEEKERKVVSFGSIKMNKASGVGGAVYGKTYEIMGWESGGKSTICLQTMTNVQKQGGRVLLIDSEHSFDESYALALGMNLSKDKFKLIQPNFAEQAFDYASAVARAKLFDMIVFDSQTGLIPKKGFEGDTTDSVLGLKARLMSAEVPKLVTLCGNNNILLYFISQYREKIGVMFGSPITTSGGNALKFYSHARIEISKSVKAEEELNFTKFKFVKNKLAKPYGKGEFNIVWGKGVDNNDELLDLSIEAGIIKKSGSWFSYEDTKLGQGFDSVKKFFDDNEGFRSELLDKLNRKEFLEEESGEQIILDNEEITQEVEWISNNIEEGGSEE